MSGQPSTTLCDTTHSFAKGCLWEFGLQDIGIVRKKPHLDKRVELKAAQRMGVTFDLSLSNKHTHTHVYTVLEVRHVNQIDTHPFLMIS